MKDFRNGAGEEKVGVSAGSGEAERRGEAPERSGASPRRNSDFFLTSGVKKILHRVEKSGNEAKKSGSGTRSRSGTDRNLQSALRAAISERSAFSKAKKYTFKQIHSPELRSPCG